MPILEGDKADISRLHPRVQRMIRIYWRMGLCDPNEEHDWKEHTTTGYIKTDGETSLAILWTP